MKDFLLNEDFVFSLTQDMEKVFDFFSKKLSYLYVDLINIEAIKKIRCVVFDKVCVIENIAAVFLKDKKTAVIEVFDERMCLKVVSCLRKLKLNIKQEGNKIFVFSDSIIGEKRILLEKEVKKMEEYTKILIRQIRQTFFNKSRAMFKNKLISEDILLRNGKVIQEVTNSFIKNIENLVKKKIESILRA